MLFGAHQRSGTALSLSLPELQEALAKALRDAQGGIFGNFVQGQGLAWMIPGVPFAVLCLPALFSEPGSCILAV